MRHDPDFTLAHPVTPLSDCPPAVQRLVDYKAPGRAATTRDGRASLKSSDVGRPLCKMDRHFLGLRER
jgi:hypothetical protein